MQVKIQGNVPGGYQIVPQTDDEVLICDVTSYCCGFDSYEEAEEYCNLVGWEIIE